jgi:hypothetical protein
MAAASTWVRKLAPVDVALLPFGRYAGRVNVRPKLLCFLLAALLVRLLVPAGYMIDTAGAHGVRIVLCAGDGVQAPPASPMRGSMHNAAHHHDHDGRGEGHSLCPYAALSNASSPPPLAAALPPPPAPAPLGAPAHAVRAIRLALAAPPPPATGPPALRA